MRYILDLILRFTVASYVSNGRVSVAERTCHLKPASVSVSSHRKGLGSTMKT